MIRGARLAEIGTILGGRYRLVELLGQGGMATIYRARDTQLERDVAVKLLRPEYGRDPDFSSRFRQEAQTAASLNHPNVVASTTTARTRSGRSSSWSWSTARTSRRSSGGTAPLPPRAGGPDRGGGRPGPRRRPRARHRPSRREARQRPRSARDGRVKVADFGIARAVAEAQMTLPGTTLGSVHYFSPEQARGEQATDASDIYALGIVLFEMLTGSRPWEGDSAAAVALARLHAARSRSRRSSAPASRRISRRSPARPWPPTRRPVRLGRPDGRCARVVPNRGRCARLAAASRRGLARRGACGRGGAVAAPSPGCARSNPTVTPYPADAYASAGDVPVAASPVTDRAARPSDDEGAGTSPVVWIAGIARDPAPRGHRLHRVPVALGAPRRLSPQQVAVPEFVGKLLATATQEAEALGIELDSHRASRRTSRWHDHRTEPPAEAQVAAGRRRSADRRVRCRDGADARPPEQDRGPGGPGDRDGRP